MGPHNVHRIMAWRPSIQIMHIEPILSNAAALQQDAIQLSRSISTARRLRATKPHFRDCYVHTPLIGMLTHAQRRKLRPAGGGQVMPPMQDGWLILAPFHERVIESETGS